MNTITLSVSIAVSLSLGILSAQVEEEMLTIRQPVDIVTAVETAKRAAKHMGRDIDTHVITSATYFGDDALPFGPNLPQKEEVLRELAKEKGIPLPCWIVKFSQKTITADRVDDYIESTGITVFVSSPNQAAVVDYKFEDLPGGF